MVYIYILKLEELKWYIGKSNNVAKRLNDHYINTGSEWTKKYKPIEVFDIISDCNNFDEDKYVLDYMNMYGIDNVRGGSFCRIQLDEYDRIIIEKMIRGATDKCLKCGSSDHFVKFCTKSRSDISRLLSWSQEMIKDHHRIYIIDRMNNHYYYNKEGPLSCTAGFNYDNCILGLNKKGVPDIVYTDDNYKLIFISESGIKQFKRKLLEESIKLMIQLDDFVYVEI